MKSTNQFAICLRGTRAIFNLLIGIIFILNVFNGKVCGQTNKIYPVSSDMRIRVNSMKLFNGNVATDPNLLKLRIKKTQTGSFYLNENWKKADICMLTDSTIVEGLDARIDLRNNELEVKYNGEIKVIKSYRVRSVVFTENEELFITENVLKSSEYGFFKLIVDGESSLLCKVDAELQASNYNIQLDAGRKAGKIIKKKHYFIYSNKKLIEIKRTKNKLKKQFSKLPVLTNFIKNMKINPKKEENLIALTKFMNTNQYIVN